MCLMEYKDDKETVPALNLGEWGIHLYKQATLRTAECRNRIQLS